MSKRSGLIAVALSSPRRTPEHSCRIRTRPRSPSRTRGKPRPWRWPKHARTAGPWRPPSSIRPATSCIREARRDAGRKLRYRARKGARLRAIQATHQGAAGRARGRRRGVADSRAARRGAGRRWGADCHGRENRRRDRPVRGNQRAGRTVCDSRCRGAQIVILHHRGHKGRIPWWRFWVAPAR